MESKERRTAIVEREQERGKRGSGIGRVREIRGNFFRGAYGMLSSKIGFLV